MYSGGDVLGSAGANAAAGAAVYVPHRITNDHFLPRFIPEPGHCAQWWNRWDALDLSVGALQGAAVDMLAGAESKAGPGQLGPKPTNYSLLRYRLLQAKRWIRCAASNYIGLATALNQSKL